MINQLLKRSKEVFYDCLLPNNCLVAAPVHMPYYPLNASNYLRCWPGRDLGFSITGAQHLGIDAYSQVLSWIWDRAENFQKAESKSLEGLLIKSYYTHGRMAEGEFQPDQNATLLWAIHEYSKVKELGDLEKKVLEKATKGLVNAWGKGYFKRVNQDLWEEVITHPRFRNNHTYTLAACAAGLELSNRLVPNKKAEDISKKMKELINEDAYDEDAGYFVSRFGGGIIESDKRLDASMLGLVWPFEIIEPSDKRMTNTISAIENELVDDHGVRRYKQDLYEGELEGVHILYRMGAGAWPLLTFCMSIVQSKMGNKDKAEKYFRMVLDQVGEDLLIPEQFFAKKDPRVGVNPLLWSHMMFVHAAKELGYIENEIY